MELRVFPENLSPIVPEIEFFLNQTKFSKKKEKTECSVSVIEHGYSLPFVHLPDPLSFRNLQSALKHYSFVSSASSQLVPSGVVEETRAEAVLLCSPLGAVPKKSGNCGES